jgi:hypothetical protein
MGVGARARKLISAVPPEYLKQILNEKVYIFNISDLSYGPISRTHSNTILPGRSAGETANGVYSVTPITGRVEYADAGIEDSVNQQVTSATQIAEDLCDWCNGNLPRCDVMPNVPVFVGVWWETTPEPTRLKEMVERKKNYNKALVAQANSFAETEAGRKNINDMMRAAARELGLQPKWLFLVTDEMKPCAACGTAVMPTVAVCPNCNAILDAEKARQFFPERFLHRAGSGESFSSDAAE